jgi:hypothetical protein
MATFANVDLSDIIVSMANAVSDANEVLNTDPLSAMAITSFEIDTTLTAVISVPIRATPRSKLRFTRESSGLFRIADYEPKRVLGLRLSELLQPTIWQAVMPTSQTESARLRIKAKIEAVPNMTTAAP